MGNPGTARLLQVGTLIVAFVGCTGTDTATPGPSATQEPSPTPTVAPSVTPDPSPTSAAFEGTASESLLGGPDWENGAIPAFGTIDSGDPRVAGWARVIAYWGEQDPLRGKVLWGTQVYWNEGGTWDGSWSGVVDEAGHHVIDAVQVGSEDYTGLVLLHHLDAPPAETTLLYMLGGSIQPAAQTDGPTNPSSPRPNAIPVTGSRSCGEAPWPPVELPPGDFIRTRGEVDVCAWEVSDDRLTGLDSTIVNANEAPDGSVAAWGTVSLRVGDDPTDAPYCGWVGPYSLARGVDGTTTIRMTLEGVGDCAGLVYQDVETGSGDTWTVAGWLSPSE